MQLNPSSAVTVAAASFAVTLTTSSTITTNTPITFVITIAHFGSLSLNLHTYYWNTMQISGRVHFQLL